MTYVEYVKELAAAMEVQLQAFRRLIEILEGRVDLGSSDDAERALLKASLNVVEIQKYPGVKSGQPH